MFATLKGLISEPQEPLPPYKTDGDCHESHSFFPLDKLKGILYQIQKFVVLCIHKLPFFSDKRSICKEIAFDPTIPQHYVIS